MKRNNMKKYPEIKITVQCWDESVTHRIKWDSNAKRYKDIFKSILRFNWFKDEIIKKDLWL